MLTTGPDSYVVDDYWLCDYCDPCLIPVSQGGSSGREKPDKRPKLKKPERPRQKPGRDSIADFAIAAPGAAEFFAAADAAEPAPVVFVESAPPPLYPEQPPVDLEPTQQAIARANAAIAQAFAAEQARTAQLEQQARSQQQKIVKILAVVNFVESLNGA